MHRLASLAGFLLLVVVTAAVAGQFVGGSWYQIVNQPAWNPSPMVMASAWAVLYVLMAVSAWMVWDTMRGLAMIALTWWGVQLLLSVCWSWMYFGLGRIGWSLVPLSLWFFAALMTVRVFRPIKLEASSLMMPVAGWLLFFWVLNFVQWHLNGGGLGSIF